MADKKNIWMIVVILAIVAFLVFGLSGQFADRGVGEKGDAQSTITITPPEPGQPEAPKPTSGATGAAITILPVN